MVRFRLAQHAARDEYLIEAYVPQAGNDAALIAVFNSEIAANTFVEFLNFLAQLYENSKK